MYFLNTQFQLFSHKLYLLTNCDDSSLGHLLSFCRTKENRCTKLYTIWGAQDIGTPNFGSQNIGSRTFQPQEGICTHILHSNCTLISIRWIINVFFFQFWSIQYHKILQLASFIRTQTGIFCDKKLPFYHNNYNDGKNPFFIWKALLFTIFFVW